MLDRRVRKKSGLIAAFFYLLLVGCADVQAAPASLDDQAIRNASRDPVWLALLHSGTDGPQIKEKGFLLSLPAFSAKEELSRTVELLYGADPTAVCRFPARYLWLQKRLLLPPLPLEACPQVAEFRQKAPADDIYLIFASENIAQPASILGHSFIKLSGHNEEGELVSHAVSFYTDVDTINVPWLLYESLIVGKRGFFSLSPFEEKRVQYVDFEQRSLWEYKLALDSFQRELVRLHLLELKEARLTYYFHSYNCATVVNFIIALSGRPVAQSMFWLTPKDIIKNAEAAGLILESSVTTPSRWMVKAVADVTPLRERSEIRRRVLAGEALTERDISASDADFFKLQTARSYNHYAFYQGEIEQERWNRNDTETRALQRRLFPDREIVLNNQLNPIHSPPERQVSVYVRSYADEALLGMSFRPVSHSLSDDNRSYSAESGMELMTVSVASSLRRNPGTMVLDNFTLYRVKSLMPYDQLTGGISGEFGLGYHPQYSDQLELKRALSADGSLGITVRPVSDIDLYLLSGLGLGYRAGDYYLHSKVEVGAIVRAVWDMKTLLTLARIDNELGAGSHYYRVILGQSKFITRNWSVNVGGEARFNENEGQSGLSMTINRLF